MKTQLFWTSNKRAQTYCDQAEFAEVLAEVGLTPTPLPELPAKIHLSPGLLLHARQEFIGGAMDEKGTDRIVVTIAEKELW